MKIYAELIERKNYKNIEIKSSMDNKLQSVGEMELSALLSKNNKSFIEHTRKGRAQEENQTFLNNLLALGMVVTDSRGYRQGGSDLKSTIDKMKERFRLKNGIK